MMISAVIGRQTEHLCFQHKNLNLLYLLKYEFM